MRLLLDTHVFLWACIEPERLSASEQDAIGDPRNDVFVSAASAWEIAIKRALGRLSFPAERFDEFADAMGFRLLPITSSHGIAAGGLPPHHGNPFDRMLIAQAKAEGLAVVTNDGRFPQYDVALFSTAKS